MKKISAILFSFVMITILLTSVSVFGATDKKELEFNVSSVTGKRGETVDVTIRITNNPGIASFKLLIGYDDVLELKNVQLTDQLGSYFTAPKPYSNPQTVSLLSPFEDVRYAGEIVRMTFGIKEDTGAAELANIRVQWDQDDVFDSDGNPVLVSINDGRVSFEPEQTKEPSSSSSAPVESIDEETSQPASESESETASSSTNQDQPNIFQRIFRTINSILVKIRAWILRQ